ncbi:MAG TPA: carboxypeptidase-like regulatory domain-containing protein [Bryobacteraceae bacterium]|nr:carboxypeptidase-like regulatory domain-containing protein [Bryobacteraceae bacterium]
MCLLMVAGAANVFAQAGLSAITGAVHDSSGAAVARATVTVTNESKGIRREMESNEAGVFNAPALVPAPGYSLEVARTGFANFITKDISLTVGQTLNIPVSLEVAAAASTLDVTADAPVVDADKTGVATSVDQTLIENLPSNGRRVDNFVPGTSPAVTNDGDFGLLSFRGVAMGNSFLTDGNDTTESFYNENAGRTRIGSQISAGAVQEFQVLSDGFAAEFGRCNSHRRSRAG